jgi:hypothetical protein
MKTLLIEDLTMKDNIDRKAMLAVHGGIIGGCADIRTDTFTGYVHHVILIVTGSEPATCLTKSHGGMPG